ncbi:MAG TPA: hypothetical protein VGC64_10365 [Pyrinomonadaceae bacterium]
MLERLAGKALQDLSRRSLRGHSKLAETTLAAVMRWRQVAANYDGRSISLSASVVAPGSTSERHQKMRRAPNWN